MNPKHESIRTDERGIALVSVVLLMLVVSALTAAMAVSAKTEVLVSHNHQSAAQAHMAAEAGLNHAASVVVSDLALWQAHGFATPSDAMSRLLRGPDNLSGAAGTDLDNGSLEAMGIPRSPARTALGTVPGVAYEARIFDEDDPLSGVTLAAADVARIGENANATSDGNRRLVLRSTGYALDGTRVVLDAVVGPVTLPAVVTNRDLTINGTPNIIGLAGGVHSNEDLTLLGTPSIAQEATASGDYSTTGNPAVGGDAGGSFPQLWIPPVRASDYRFRADFILTAGGLITTPLGGVLCNASAVFNACRPAYGWVYLGPGNGWDITGNSGANGTFYVEGPAKISGNPGSPATPLVITIIAEGSIEITGNPDLRADTPELLFVTDGDLKIAGSVDVPLAVEGQMLVHEQIMIVGNPTLAGQILAEDAADLSNVVVGNQISGNATISYNGTIGTNMFAVISWREVR